MWGWTKRIAGKLWRAVKRAGKAVGRTVVRAAKAVGRGARAVARVTVKAAKAVGRGVAKGAKAVARVVVKGAKAVGRAVKSAVQLSLEYSERAGRAIGRGVKRAAIAVRDAVKESLEWSERAARSIGRGIKRAAIAVRDAAVRVKDAFLPTLRKVVGAMGSTIRPVAQYLQILGLATIGAAAIIGVIVTPFVTIPVLIGAGGAFYGLSHAWAWARKNPETKMAQAIMKGVRVLGFVLDGAIIVGTAAMVAAEIVFAPAMLAVHAVGVGGIALLMRGKSADEAQETAPVRARRSRKLPVEILEEDEEEGNGPFVGGVEVLS